MQYGQINVSVANLYSQPQYRSEVVSQALLGEKCTIVQSDRNFSKIILEDGYEGWISDQQWVKYSEGKHNSRKVRAHFIRIFEKPDFLAQPVRDAVIGTHLNIVAELPEWFRVLLPDGKTGYVAQRGFGPFPATSRNGIRELAMEFYGYPYQWGGRSPKGFDCSGFVQTVFALLNMNLPRDAWMQYRQAVPVSNDPQRANTGDLCFFAEQPEKISHVGIALGAGKIIHARGMVGVNSISRGAADFRKDLADSFVEVRTYFS
jgi:hypothetical protein